MSLFAQEARRKEGLADADVRGWFRGVDGQGQVVIGGAGRVGDQFGGRRSLEKACQSAIASSGFDFAKASRVVPRRTPSVPVAV